MEANQTCLFHASNPGMHHDILRDIQVKQVKRKGSQLMMKTFQARAMAQVPRTDQAILLPFLPRQAPQPDRIYSS